MELPVKYDIRMLNTVYYIIAYVYKRTPFGVLFRLFIFFLILFLTIFIFFYFFLILKMFKQIIIYLTVIYLIKVLPHR